MDDHSGGDRTGPYATPEFDHTQRIDEILSALAHTQRRRVLYSLEENDPTSRIEIARRLAAWERDTTPTTVSEEAVRVTETELHHTHLPKLQDARLIEYDRRSEHLLRRKLPDLVEHCLEICILTDLPP